MPREGVFEFPREEPPSVMSQPDILIADQYMAVFRRTSHIDPEKRLMVAILEDAVACFQKYLLERDKKKKDLFREAEEWILARDPDWPFSFDNICEALGLDPDYLRQGLLQWKRLQLKAQEGRNGGVECDRRRKGRREHPSPARPAIPP